MQEEHDEHVLVSTAQGVLMTPHECSAAHADDLIRNAADHNGERVIATAERILSAVRTEETSEGPAASPT